MSIKALGADEAYISTSLQSSSFQSSRGFISSCVTERRFCASTTLLLWTNAKQSGSCIVLEMQGMTNMYTLSLKQLHLTYICHPALTHLEIGAGA